MPSEGKGRFMILIVFIIEHFAFLIIWFIRKYIKSRNHWTKIYKERSEYRKKIK